ncbi:hypothetical protein KGP36_01795 [Patescibacteria group bacterium]|nr:hypothetical protein [Patescibacteria group bacterium]
MTTRTLKRAALIALLAAASCAPLRTYTDVVRMYGNPESIDTLPHGYTLDHFKNESGREAFGFSADGVIKWHYTDSTRIDPLPHF